MSSSTMLKYIILIIILIIISIYLWFYYLFDFCDKQMFGKFIDKTNSHIYNITLVDCGAISNVYFQIQVTKVKSKKWEEFYNYNSYYDKNSVNKLSNVYIGDKDTVRISFINKGQDTTITFVSGELQE